MKGALLLCWALGLAAPALAQHAHSDHHPPAHDDAPMRDHAAHAAMTGALGPYPAGREASGTSWQPEAAGHHGAHAAHGDWRFMSHALLNAVYDWQGGPRGGEKAFVAGMIMGAARRDFDNGGALTLRAMLSPDPFMGRSGYPLLLAAGETANGVDPLVDRQHPHDLFMELSASYAQRVDARSSFFVYAGLPGEPAFGPPAFMHRPAAIDSPEAPITHHWLDSTHITFGVATLGYVNGAWKIEGSRFRGREPDEERYDIETGALDSTALRLSYNPSPRWALQLSWADVKSPEQLEPEDDETRWSASALYSRPLGAGVFSMTAAFARKDGHHGASDAALFEAALQPDDRWTLFARGEWIETSELGAGDGNEDVARASLGALHDWRVGDNVRLGVGALYQRAFVSEALAPSYGGDQDGAMAFVRIRID
ncbi:MAG: hypothetical protein HXY28_01550 [Hydrogenophilaceae bacterium]|jgi:hypothetical protein|nr:hypothetical protein [Hydrogenophilaceae bacterium]